jgi:hypothetical protein
MPSARALAPSHRTTRPGRARWLARVLVLAALGAAIAVPSPAAADASPYAKLERLALSLLNCTRTGGWVQPDGSCDGYGSGRYSSFVRPLRPNPGIASAIARPYAYRLAKADACMHTLAGTSIAWRFSSAGYTGHAYGESIGCSGGYTVRQMVIRTHRMMQAEASYNGWHWRNMKDRDFRSVGVGVMAHGSESRVVYDFWGR